MTATPSPKGVEPKEPEPTLLDLFLQSHLLGCNLTPCNCGHDKLIQFIATLTAERNEAQKERDELKAANAKLEELVKRARGQLDAGLAALHGEKSELNLEVEA